MNRALFFPEEISADFSVDLPPTDRRAMHIRKVLRAKPGDSLQIGIIDQGIGTARIAAVSGDGVCLVDVLVSSPPEEPVPLVLLLGHPRPIVLRRIIKDATSAGLVRIHVTGTDLGEKSYLESALWSDAAQLQELLVLGAEQGGACRLPQ
ncbi:MAG: 16S rRNA (uracil(1498)-N(3))-methyltransferase, partial [Spirochaetaceae bacterium]